MVLLKSLNLPLGEPVKNFSLKGVDEKVYSLDDFSHAKILVIVFMCNHCPYVQAVWGRLNKLQEKFLKDGVQFVGINPNLNPDYEEETFEKMQEYYKKFHMNFSYLQDDTQNIARKYKAQCTPDIYVFDGERKLAYHGRIDDNWQDESKVTKQELAEALLALIKGEKILDVQNPSMGCSIKWR
jgi:peroxiredoxin